MFRRSGRGEGRLSTWKKSIQTDCGLTCHGTSTRQPINWPGAGKRK